MTRLGSLVGVFGLLSVLAVGGGVAVLPEMERLTVADRHWLTSDQFVDIYGLGQLAPGPNMLMVTVIGYHVAGALGALAVAVAFFFPACFLTFVANRLWHHVDGSPWQQAVQRGLAPVTIGLMCSGVVALAKVALIGATTLAISATVLLILLRSHVNPGLLILASGVAGWLLLAP